MLQAETNQIPASSVGLICAAVKSKMLRWPAKGVGRNFSRGWLPAIFQISGGGSTLIFGRFNGQNNRIFGPGGPWTCPAYACLRLWLNRWSRRQGPVKCTNWFSYAVSPDGRLISIYCTFRSTRPSDLVCSRSVVPDNKKQWIIPWSFLAITDPRHLLAAKMWPFGTTVLFLTGVWKSFSSKRVLGVDILAACDHVIKSQE